MKKNLANTFALSAAALFLAGCGKEKTTPPDGEQAAPVTAEATPADPNKKQRCYGVNECAGQTACDVTGKWDCGGNNDCCGKGWLNITRAACDELGGSDDEATLANPPIDCSGKGPAAEAEEAPAEG